jgi:hypothetical protein
VGEAEKIGGEFGALVTIAPSQPAVVDTEEEEALGEEDLSIIHHRAPARLAGHELIGIRSEDEGPEPRVRRASSEDDVSHLK